MQFVSQEEAMPRGARALPRDTGRRGPWCGSTRGPSFVPEGRPAICRTRSAAVLAVAVLAAPAAAAPVVDPLTDTTVFPIAVWAMPARTAPAFAALGVNTFVAEQGEARGWLDTLAAHGVVGFVHWSGRRDETQRQAIAASGGFLGWMHGDEPDNPEVVDDEFRTTRTPPERLRAATEAMRASSTPAPMYLNLGQGLANGINQTTPDSLYVRFCQTADIVCYDVYPTSTQENGVERLHLVARGVERLRQLAGPGKPVWIWLECTAIRDGNAGIGNRAPHAHELRAQVWLALVHGADGIGYFPHQFNPYRGGPEAIPAPLQAEMGRTNGLLHALAPLLRTGQRQRVAVDADAARVSAALWRRDGQALLAVVNQRPAPTQAALRLPPDLGDLQPLGGAAAEASGSAAGQLTVRLRPHEVALYAVGLSGVARDVDYAYPAAAVAEGGVPTTPASLPTVDGLAEQPGGAPAAWSRSHRTRLAVPGLATAPAVDGRLEEAAWQQAASLGTWTHTAGTAAATVGTQARLGRHGERLYLAFEAQEPHLDSLVSRYAALWRNDCVEVWFDPANQRTSFAHLVATADGRLQPERTVPDEWGEGRRDEGWAPRAQLATGRAAGAWTAELAVDLADLGDIADGAVIAFDAARERQPGGGENTAWTLGRFNGALYFGELVLTSSPLSLVDGVLHNRAADPLEVRVEILVSAPRAAEGYADWEARFTDVARQRRTVRVPAAVGGQVGRLAVLDDDLARRVPAGGRVKVTLLEPGPAQWEELLASPAPAAVVD